MRNVHCIYRSKKHTEDEATPMSGTEPTSGGHVFQAINASRDEEFINDFPASLDPKW